MKLFAVVYLLLIAVPGHAGSVYGLKGIYGVDDRKDYYETTNELIKQSFRGVTAIFSTSNMMPEGDVFNLVTEKIGDKASLCESEPFRDQPTAAFCSGALIDRDIVLTAGHCITDDFDCSQTSLGFDFMVSESSVYPTSIPASKVYRCARVISRLQISELDYAIIKLDRPVTDRDPLPVEKQANLQVGDQLYVIGHPLGIPSKSDTGKIRTLNETNVVTTLDTYGGNSGSPVFNLNTGKIIGLLYKGEHDFVEDGYCRQSMVCDDDGCMGEYVSRATSIFKTVDQSVWRLPSAHFRRVSQAIGN